MSNELLIRRGTTAQHTAFTGAAGEVTFNTDTNQLVTHDGATAGGFPHVKAGDLAASTGASLVGYMPAGAVATTVQAKLRESVSVLDFIPVAQHAAIQANISTYDCTDDIAVAIAECSFLTGGGGDYGFEKVLRFPQGTYPIKYIDVTARRNVWLYAEGYVSLKGIDSTVKNFIFGTTNYNVATPEASTQTPDLFMGGPGTWALYSAAGTAYQYGMRLEHVTSSHFENVNCGGSRTAVTDVAPIGSIVGAYLQYTYSNLFVNCGFSNPAAPPVGYKSYGLYMGNNNNNSNTFLRCSWQASNVTTAPYLDTIGVNMSGANNVWDNCDLSEVDTAFIGVGVGTQIRNIYSEYITTFVSGPSSGQLLGCTVQGGIIEIVNDGSAFVLQNTENFTIIGGYYKSAFVGTRTFINQSGNSLYGITIINPKLVTGAFTNYFSGTYHGATTTNQASVLQTNWLSFPPTQVPSPNVNTLDDYEEGTWTPVKVAGLAFTTASGRYTKVGNLVTATFIVTFAVEVSAAAIDISGFPFPTGASNSEINGLAVGYNTGTVPVCGTLAVTTMRLRQNGSPTTLAVTPMSGATLSGTMTYTTS